MDSSGAHGLEPARHFASPGVPSVAMEEIAKDSWPQRARKRAINRHDDEGVPLWMRAERESDAGNAKEGLALLMRPKGPFPARRS